MNATAKQINYIESLAEQHTAPEKPVFKFRQNVTANPYTQMWDTCETEYIREMSAYKSKCATKKIFDKLASFAHKMTIEEASIVINYMKSRYTRFTKSASTDLIDNMPRLKKTSIMTIIDEWERSESLYHFSLALANAKVEYVDGNWILPA